MRHNSKNKYLDGNAAQRAASKYTQKFGFVHRWYRCDECEYGHIATVRHYGVPVISADALGKNKGTDES